MTAHDTRKLIGCQFALIQALDRVLQAMGAVGHPMMVTDGFRSAAEQKDLVLERALYAQGRTEAGHIVTYADGTPGHESNHQSGRAADCCFVVNGKPSWDQALPWQLYRDTAVAEGLEAGYDWPGKQQDKPHVQLAAEKVVKT